MNKGYNVNAIVQTIENKLGIKGMNVFDAVRHTRETLSATTNGQPDPDLTYARSVDLIKSFGVEDPTTLIDGDKQARLFATALVSTLVNNRDNFSLDKAIEEARIKVANVEAMVGKKVAKVKPKAVKETKPKAAKPARASRSAVDLTAARDIFKAEPEARVYDMVTKVAEAYGVDRAKAYGILHKVRKEAK
jgi:hypothetical protein